MGNTRLYFNGLRLRFKELVNGDQNMFATIKELFRDTPNIDDVELEEIETVGQFWTLLESNNVISMDNVRKLKELALELENERLKQIVEDYESKTKGIVWSILEDAGARVLRVAAELSCIVVVRQGFEKFVLKYARNRENRRHLERNVLPRSIRVLDVSEGCLCFVLETSYLTSLKELWTSYKDGSLKEKFKKAINEIDEVRKLSEGTEMDVSVMINEEEYREAYWVLFCSKISQDEDQPRGQQRRHSLSCKRDLSALVKPDLTLQEWVILNETKNKVVQETKRRKDAEKGAAKLRPEGKLLKVEAEKETLKLQRPEKPEMLTKVYGEIRQIEKKSDDKFKKLNELREMSIELVWKLKRLITADDPKEIQTSCKQQEQELQEAVSVDNREREDTVYESLGKACQSQGRYDKAILYYVMQTEVAITKEDQPGVEKGYRNLGSVCQSGGNYHKATEFHEKSLEMAKEMGDIEGEINAHLNLGFSYNSLGEYHKAIEHCKKSLEMAREMGDRRVEISAYLNLGFSFHSLGEYHKAIEHCKKGLEMAKGIGDMESEKNAYLNLGFFYNSLGEYHKAIEHCKKGLEMAKEMGNRKVELITAYLILGFSCHSLGEYHEAIEHYKKSLEMAIEIGDMEGEKNAYLNLGVSYHSLGECPEALEHCKKSLEVAKEMGDGKEERNAYLNLGIFYHFLGEDNKAIEYRMKRLEMAKEMGDRKEERNAYLNFSSLLRLGFFTGSQKKHLPY